MSLPPLTSWVAAGLRVTAFPSAMFRPAESRWWAELTGAEPENRTSRPRAGEFVDEGVHEGRKLVLHVQPERIDCHLLPVDDPADGGLELPSIGAYPDARDVFQTVLHRWLDLVPPPVRLAYGAVLLQPAPDRRAGYVQVMEYVPALRLDPDRSSDLLFQVNHPHRSQIVVDLEINRLMKWSVMRLGRLNFRVGGVSSELRQTEERFACRLELDVNTSAQHQDELPPGSLHDLLRELIDVGSQIAANGESL